MYGQRFAVLVSLFVLLNTSLFCFTDVLFSPDNHPTNKLLDLLGRAKKKIYAAVYMITDKEIAQALIDAKGRGVDVKIIIDEVSYNSKFGKGKLLKQHHVDLFVYTPKTKSGKHRTCFQPIMHHKFAIIDDMLWMGSFNWTKSANKQNQENVLMTDEKAPYQKFENHFEVLKERCMCVSYAQPTRQIAQESWWDWIKNKIFGFWDTVCYILLGEKGGKRFVGA